MIKNLVLVNNNIHSECKNMLAYIVPMKTLIIVFIEVTSIVIKALHDYRHSRYHKQIYNV